jgi:hypothetical protein
MNRYVDKMNEEFFRPRNLYCVVMTWNPEDPSMETDVHLQSTVAIDAESAAEGPPNSRMNKMKHDFRVSSGNSFEFSETAPLVFPALEGLSEDGSENGKQQQGRLKRGKRFVTEYMDKRAQAKWAGQNPDSKLANTVKPEFKSRYADPTNPASSGDLAALLTGGKISLGRGVGGGGFGRGE